MSTDFSIRPVGTPAPSPVTPSSPAATAGVATDLPPSQTVTAPDASAGLRTYPQQSQDVSHQVIFDSAAVSFVFQVVDQKTDQVVTQFPDEAMLRRRAYFHTLDLSKAADTARPLATDRSA